MHILIKSAHIFSPLSKHHLAIRDVEIKNGIVEQIGTNLKSSAKKIISQKNIWLSDGWLDIFSDFCEPGNEQHETLATGRNCAMMGGYTDVCLLPNTTPCIDNKSQVQCIIQSNKDELVQLHPIGGVSKKLEGKELAEMYDMQQHGAIAFSDGKNSIQSAGLLIKALQYIKPFDGQLIQIPNDAILSKFGLMNESEVSTKLGLQGIPLIAETTQLQRDVTLSQYAESNIHFTGVSTKKSLSIIKKARKNNPQITCSVTPYHLLFTENELEQYNTLYKTMPPLRGKEDMLALRNAIDEGTIDCIATHHFPQNWDAKTCEFDKASEGMIGLHTTFYILNSLGFTEEKICTLLSQNPRQILNKQIQIEIGKPACITLFTTQGSYTYHDKNNPSISSNTPFLNHTFKGKIIGVCNNKMHFWNE